MKKRMDRKRVRVRSMARRSKRKNVTVALHKPFMKMKKKTRKMKINYLRVTAAILNNQCTKD